MRSTGTKEELKKLWDGFFNHLYETSTYSELLFCCALSKSKVYLSEQDAEHNVEIMGKYNYFFRSLESGICYATVLSITQLFEDGKNKQKRTLSFLLDEAKKYKINRDEEFETLKEKHKESLEMLKSARDTYFAHREKDYVLPTIPSSDNMYELINDIARLLNSMGRDLVDGGVSYWWKDEEAGFKKEVQTDFQHVLDNLYRGEAARLADISVMHRRKLYDDGRHDIR
ncbi:hypothetical protein KJ848_00635 [Patescibacteria group bacterium]|nr:hypothetical protein [Patescibacteria group bacterium]MBU2158680.1 hypothetical protein [Patescibacteria group bacterium]